MTDLGASEIQRILIVKPSSPGDIIHALPVARRLRAALPNAHIAWLVATNFVNLLEREESIDEIIPFDRKRYGRFGRSIGASGAFIGFLNDLRRRRFDMVLDLQGLFRSGLFTFATGARQRVGFRNARELAGLLYNQRVDVPDEDIHAVERNLLFLRTIGLADAERLAEAESRDGEAERSRNEHRLKTGATAQTRPLDSDATARTHRLDTGATARGAPSMLDASTHSDSNEQADLTSAVNLRIRFDENDLHVVEELKTEFAVGATDRYVVLVPATRWETKQWDAARYGELAARIYEQYSIPSILVGGASDIERGNHAVASADGHAHNLCGKTTLRQLAAIIDRAALVVTADSTPMHIAAAHDVPIVALFGPTSPVRTGPYGHQDDVLRLDLDCSPCYLRKLRQCPHQHRCMVDLTVERVMNEVTQRLSASNTD